MKRLFEIVSVVLMLVCFNVLAVHAQSSSVSDPFQYKYVRAVYPFEKMHYAAMNGDVKTVKSLLPNVTTRDVEKSLIAAAKYGHVNVVKELLAQDDIDVNAKNEEGMTALIVAALNGHVVVVQELLKHNDVDVNARDTRDYTALIVAALNGNVAVVQELLKRDDIDVNARNAMDQTALFGAAKHGHVNVIKELLKREEVVSNRAECQRAIELARSRNHEEAARVIEEALQKSDAQLEAAVSSQLNLSLNGK